MGNAPKNYEREGKHRMSELPLDLLAELLCPAYKEGTDYKYYRYSWRKGFKLSVMMDACLRHLNKFFNDGEDYDQEAFDRYGLKKHHLGAAIFCIISMYNDWKYNPNNDDRPKTDFYNPEKNHRTTLDEDVINEVISCLHRKDIKCTSQDVIELEKSIINYNDCIKVL